MGTGTDRIGRQGTATTLRIVAYHALWDLYEQDPLGEPPYFRRTRLDLHDCLSEDAFSQSDEAPRSSRCLSLV